MSVNKSKTNKNNELVYYFATQTDKTSYFEITKTIQNEAINKYIYNVSVAIPNSCYQYCVSFKDCNTAFEYVEKMQDEYY